METRKTEIVELYKNGVKLAEIGRQFGISRQRVWQIVKTEYQNNNTGKKPRCMIKRPIKSEEFVHNKLKELGINFEICGYNEYYDLNINGKKVEIKQRSHTRITKIRGRYYSYYIFNYLKPKYPIDYFIFICGNLDENTKCYIYPASKIKNFLFIKDKYVNKVKKSNLLYLDNWSVFK